MLLGNDYEDYDDGAFRSALQQPLGMPGIAWNLFHIPFMYEFTVFPPSAYFAPDGEHILADDLMCALCGGGEL